MPACELVVKENEMRNRTSSARSDREGRRNARASSWTVGPARLIVLLVLLLSLVPRPTFAAALPRVHPDLLNQARQNPEQSFRVIIGRHQNDQAADSAVETKGYAKLEEIDNVGFVSQIRGKDL